jgi:hypothetical protein
MDSAEKQSQFARRWREARSTKPEIRNKFEGSNSQMTKIDSRFRQNGSMG